jgi:hypothetical protein
MSNLRLPHAKAEETFRRSILLTALYTMAIWLSLRSDVVTDPDIGWHLRTGQWILEHGTVTATDPFSSYGQGKPWVAYSWLFEIMVYGLYRAFGLVGFVFYNVALAMGITLALQSLLRKLEAHAAKAIGLTGLGIMAFAPILSPRPWLFTILFFIIEFDILLAARRSGNPRRLFLLPLIFALWANIHIQFIYGFIPFGLFLLEPLIEQLFRHPFSLDKLTASFNPRHWLLAVICMLATLATPYHLKLYIPIIEYIQKTGAFRYVTELQALDFRSLTHWLIPALAIWAAFVLGWRREVKPFPVFMLLLGAFFAFRSGRDLWVVVVVALSIIATARPTLEASDRFAVTKTQMLLVGAALSLLIFFTARKRDISETAIQTEIAKKYPVTAAQTVAAHRYPGPLYNHFNWGGYLIWRLPHLPVSMDGRTNLHGDERIERSIKTWEGNSGWADDPELKAAQLVIADVNKPLCSLLRFDPRFELVYEDAVAAVFVARSVSSQSK